MVFQKEYEVLTSLNYKRILEISFNFQDNKIKIYFTQSKYEFLILICETFKYTFVKNYLIYHKNNVAHINMYWGNYINYALPLSDKSSWAFTGFQNKIKQSIHSIMNPSEEFKISHIDESIGIKKIRKYISNSVIRENTIYFHHIRRKPMTNEQFKKVSHLLGNEIALHIKRSGVTAVFTDDITKQKSFQLP